MIDTNHPVKHKLLTYIKPAITLFFLVLLYTHHYTDHSLNRTASGEIKNFFGTFGSYCSDCIFQIFGIVAYFIPIFIAGYIIKSVLAKKCKIVPYTLQSLLILSLISMITGFHSEFDIFYSGMIGNLGGLILGALPDLIALPILYGGVTTAIAITYNLPLITLGQLAYVELKKMAQPIEYELDDDIDITPTSDQFVQKTDQVPAHSGLDINHNQSDSELSNDWFTPTIEQPEAVKVEDKEDIVEEVTENVVTDSAESDIFENHPIFQYTPSEAIIDETAFIMHAEEQPDEQPDEQPIAKVIEEIIQEEAQSEPTIAETEITEESDLILDHKIDHQVDTEETEMIDAIFTELPDLEEEKVVAAPKIKFEQFEQTISQLESEEITTDYNENPEVVAAVEEIKLENNEEIDPVKPVAQNIILLPRSITTDTTPIVEHEIMKDILDESELLESIYEPEATIKAIIKETIIEEVPELPSIPEPSEDYFTEDEITGNFDEPVTLSSPTATIERLISMQQDQMSEQNNKLDTVLSILENNGESVQDTAIEEPTQFNLEEEAFIQESTENNRPFAPTPITRVPKGESVKPVIEVVETASKTKSEEQIIVESSFKDQFKNRLNTNIKDQMKQDLENQFKARLKEEMAARFQSKKETTEIAETAQIETPEIEIKSTVYDDEAHINDDKPKRVSKNSFYKLPSLDFLSYSPPKHQEVDREYLNENAEGIIECLEDFRVKGGEITEIFQGPTLTTYELEIQKGIRINHVTKYSDEIASALRVRNVRMVPIHKKGVIGIEVPNKDRETVWLKEIIQSEKYQSEVKNSKLTVVLGKSISGEPIVSDLAKMPHLLVAGTTGSGKSVFTNVLINSILYNATPDEVKFILIDPKMLEFSMYNDIPNLLFPVIIDPKKAAHALNWSVDEMERRYKMIADFGEKDISSYNEKAKEMIENGLPKEIRNQLQELECLKREIEVDESISEEERTLELLEITAKIDEINEKFEAPEILPYIVIVLDEYADLMMMAAKEVEISISRIAQKARAAGMHLVIATQRPDKDVVTGIIKANLPVRVALSVKGSNNSRIILDDKGAERLLGRGDMLFLGPGTSELKRIQSPWISTEEQKKILAFLRQQGRPTFSLDVLNQYDEDLEKTNIPKEDKDAKFIEALKIASESKTISASFLQRRLKLGYNRAARIVEIMEQEGIVGPPNGSKPRKVIHIPEEYATQIG